MRLYDGKLTNPGGGPFSGPASILFTPISRNPRKIAGKLSFGPLTANLTIIFVWASSIFFLKVWPGRMLQTSAGRYVGFALVPTLTTGSLPSGVNSYAIFPVSRLTQEFAPKKSLLSPKYCDTDTYLSSLCNQNSTSSGPGPFTRGRFPSFPS